MIRGIDVSSHQGDIDWAEVARDPQKIEMASTKITGGNSYVNPTALDNAEGMRSNGLYRDFYHYAFEGEWPGAGAKVEAEWFLAHLPKIEAHDTVSLDLEEGHGPLGEWSLEWLDYVRARVGFDPALYSSAGFIDAHFMSSIRELQQYPLWLAAWRETLPFPPQPWDTVAFWQYSASGRVQGINADVDMDLFNGTRDQREKYGWQGISVKPTAPPDTFNVGSGLREMMAGDGTGPLSVSMWISNAEIEWAIGQNDVQYFWHVPSGHHWRVRPS